MKTLIFFRHGKSDWDASFSHDHERPINKRGRNDARRMGRFLAEVEQLPDLILSSTALRARTTLDIASEEGEWGDIPTDLTDDLYDAAPDSVLAVIRQQADSFERMLLVGHEPTWSTMIRRLSGAANVKVSTAAMARVDVEADAWSGVDWGKGQLKWLVAPKLIRNGAQ